MRGDPVKIKARFRHFDTAETRIGDRDIVDLGKNEEIARRFAFRETLLDQFDGNIGFKIIKEPGRLNDLPDPRDILFYGESS